MLNNLATNDNSTVVRRIRVTGVVQGVGFRPFVYRLAGRYGITGWVLNDPEGVLIAAQGASLNIDRFIKAINDEPPVLAKVSGIKLVDCVTQEDESYRGFEIRESTNSGEKETIIPSDSHVCDDCLRELFTKDDRRYRYPFITCTNCGPRYSLIKELPYDRPNTTMTVFDMCEACHREYSDPNDRRYHAQPNACSECGPKVILSNAAGIVAEKEDAVLSTVKALREGRIVAIKSVGGFHLAVNANDGEAVSRLRQRKRRDSKPFAIMIRSVEAAKKYVECSAPEAELLESPARPIVLLKKKQLSLPDKIAPNNPNLGVMLPAAPLHYLLLDDDELPVLVMTSGNVSGYPIAYKNETALSQLFEVADYVLCHDRDIETRVDDSVLRCTTHPGLGRTMVSFIRRSRGYAPYPVELKDSVRKIVAMGAELKTTVALAHNRKVYISQHIGDLKNDETFQSHQECATHLSRLYGVQPEWIACDMHPSFRTTRFVSKAEDKKVIRVQHHHAHMASCMAENQLEGKTIGVILDGAGYGLDGTIWGGEFLVGDYSSCKRAAHLRHIQLLGGDKAVHEPIRLGFALALESINNADEVYSKVPALNALDEQHRSVFSKMLAKKINSTPSSSMGRLFDGVAALLNICVKAEYEAQGPIEMEALLEREMSLATPYSYAFNWGSDVTQIDYRPIIQDLITDIAQGRPAAEISRRFHSTIVQIIIEMCSRLRETINTNQVVLSGGVFLNEFILVNSMIGLRQHGFASYCHHAVPTNDGGISLGQIAIANAQLSLACAAEV